MVTLGVAGLVAVLAMTDRRVIALLLALVGFLVTCRRQDMKQQALLLKVFLQTLRDIAAISPPPASDARRLWPVQTAFPRRGTRGSSRGVQRAASTDDPDLPVDAQHTNSSV
jgi:hypothetical protein